MNQSIEIKSATISDVPLILQFIKELAEHEKLLHEVQTTEAVLEETLFGEHSNTSDRFCDNLVPFSLK
jgi:N-acetylglutamate synthase-like GNAT family acetyltransferase